MSGGRHTVPVDVHLLAVRDGDRGLEVLLSRRAGDVYASGLWHALSGHVELETVVDAVVRETLEETGLVVGAADVRAAVTVHHRPPGGQARVGIFFEVRCWSGTPRVVETDKCDVIGWFALDGLPDPMVAYCRAGIDAYRAGAPVALHFQEPGDAIAYDPAADRLALVPGHADRGGVPEGAVRAFAEQAVGRITTWNDVSWARAESRVWRVRGAEGGTWYVKIHQNNTYPPEEQRRIFRRIGQLAAANHTSAPAWPAGGMLPLGKLERHLGRSPAPSRARGRGVHPHRDREGRPSARGGRGAHARRLPAPESALGRDRRSPVRDRLRTLGRGPGGAGLRTAIRCLERPARPLPGRDGRLRPPLHPAGRGPAHGPFRP
ncbi:ADP-ribose pyrophosphatase [Streptomyces venezuelae]|nr:ADP-ribose pyrophosphatase [Streptomyces venezuelae]CUM35649.1 Putative MutT-family protein [Streptomyces venezuelae]